MKNGFPLKTFLLLWLSHFYVDFFIGIWPIYKTIAQIDIAQAGIIMGIAGFTGEILQLAFGYVSDIGYRRKVLIFGMLAASSICFVTFSDGYYSLLGLMLCLMIGSGSYHPAAVGVASGLFPKKGRSILLFTTGGAVGLGVSQIVFTKSLKLFGGHVYPLMFPLLLLSVIWMFHKIEKEPLLRKTPNMKTFFSPFMYHRRSLLLLYLAQVTSYGVLLSFIFILPDILQLKGCSSWLCMGGGHMCFIFGAVLGMGLLGFVCDQWGYKKSLLGASLCGFALLYCFLLFPTFSSGVTIGLLAFLGASLYLMNPIIIAWGNHLVPESPSTVSALLMGFAWCLSNLLPALTGFLASRFITAAYITAMGTTSLFLIVSLVLIFLIPSHFTLKQSIPSIQETKDEN